MTGVTPARRLVAQIDRLGWLAEAGSDRRVGGVGGPILGGYLAGGGFALETIFYILAGLAVVGVALTLVVPSSHAAAR